MVKRERLESRLKAVRLSAGFSQQELSRRAGLTRQAVSALESEQYIPGTAVALRLARVLGCRVEELFRLHDEEPSCPVRVHGKEAPAGARIVAARVRGKLVAHPLVGSHALQEGFCSADGLLQEAGTGRQKRSARLLAEAGTFDNLALLLGCDPSLAILAAHLERRNPALRLHWLSAPSQAALSAVKTGAAHVAGSHVRDPSTGEYNRTFAARTLSRTGGVLVGYARWEQGLMVSPGNPLSLRGAQDLTRPGLRLINREKGAGAREFLDRLLADEGIPVRSVPGHDRIVASHLAVARTIAGSGADVGIGIRAVASACGLDFVPLAESSFDFTIPEDLLDNPAVDLMLDLLQSRALKDELAALPGYDLSQIGDVLARIPGRAGG